MHLSSIAVQFHAVAAQNSVTVKGKKLSRLTFTPRGAYLFNKSGAEVRMTKSVSTVVLIPILTLGTSLGCSANEGRPRSARPTQRPLQQLT